MMVDHKHRLPIFQQCRILKLSRSSVYYLAQPVSAADLTLMHQIDELHLQYPFAGSRMLRDILQNSGVSIGRKHVATLMRRMGIEILYQRPRTTSPHPGHKVFPYLLRNRQITATNQAWAMDIAYIRMRRGFFYFAAVLDWATRRVLSWRLYNSLTVDFCLETVEAPIRDHSTPEILNTDQGSQFTGTDFFDMLQQQGIQICIYGKFSWRDNVFVERLWKSVKYEKVYLHAYNSVVEPRQSLQRYFTFYNQRRPHSFLDGRAPDMVYFSALPQPQTA